MSEPIVRMTDVRAAGLCSRGAKRWFESHGLNFRDFLANGIAAGELDALNDALANKVTQYVRNKSKETK